MHLLEKPVDYSKSEEFNREVNKLTLEDAKILVKKLYEDNRNYKQLAARAAITVEQYKHLLSVFDGYSEDKENMSEVNSIGFRKILVGTFDASRNLSFWVKTLCEASKRVVFEDSNVADIFSLVGNVCCEIYTNSCDLKARKILLPEEPVGVCVRNLERAEEEKIEDPPRGFYSHQSVLINRQEGNANKLHKTGKHSHQHEKSSVNEEITSLQDEDDDDDDDDDDERSGEESHDSSSKQGASTCENDCSQGGEHRYGKETHKNFEKRRKKTFGITYPKSQNLFKHDMIHSKRICSNISARCDESEHSDNDINEDNESLNDMTKDTGTYSDLVSSKGSSKYKKKHHVNKQEGNVTKRGRKKRKSPASQNSETVAKKPRRYRKSRDSITLENSDDVRGMDDSEIEIHPSSSSSSKRYQRSNKYETSNIHKTELGKTSFRKKGQNVKKQDSGSEAEAGTSSVKPKRNKRGRRKKISVTLEQETNKTFKSRNKKDSVSSKNVPHNSDNVTKHAYVRLTNVLDDPEAQHYTDVIQYKEKHRNECDSGVRWKERTDTEETSSNKERNEIEALQEWNVLDAVSDEEDKEFDNTEDAETSNNCQASDSDAEQEETVNDDDDYDDDKGQLEIDYDDKELEDSSDGEHEESCAAKQDSNRNCDSEIESKEHKKGPSTPDVSPHESEYEDNSDVQDENDGDADSVKSNDDEDISSRSPTSGSPIYGSKESESTPPHSEEGEVMTVVDDEDNDSEYSSD